MREIAFDVTRRHVYYSEEVPANFILPPNSFDAAAAHLGSPSLANGPSTVDELDVPLPPHDVTAIKWKKKIKLDSFVVVGKVRHFPMDESQTKEEDLYQIELHGSSRPLENNECPPANPLLCPSTGLAGMPGRMTFHNEECIHDPRFKRELYDSLRGVFANLRLSKEAEAAAAGTKVGSTLTIDSPKSRFSSSKNILIRCRSDYEFSRLIFVIQTVLGYDKIIPKPYRGLPPYDPRNGIIFSQIPMYVWHTFKSLDKAVIYSFLRGDLISDTPSRPLVTGCFLCLSHDTAFVMRESGHIARWVTLNHVSRFTYCADCAHPYLSFLSDDGYPDIVFVPRAPSFGTVSKKEFNAKLKVLEVRRVVHDTCFASVMERRVIEIKLSPIQDVHAFVADEIKKGRQFNFSGNQPDGIVSCPLPKEQLGNVWREVQNIFSERDPTTEHNAAVPLYTNNTNEVPLSKDQLSLLETRLNRERGKKEDQIVGVSYAHAQNMSSSDSDDSIYVDGGSGGYSMNTSFVASAYITKADLASSHAPAPGEFVVDHHSVLMSATPAVVPASLQHTSGELNVEGMMATSFSAFAGVNLAELEERYSKKPKASKVHEDLET